MKYQHMIWALALMLLAIGCKDPLNTPSNEIPDKIQFGVGYEWTYRSYFVDTLRNVVFDSTVQKIRIERDTIINDETWYVDNYGIIRTSREDGLYMWNDGKEMIDIKIDIGVGEFYLIQAVIPPSMTIANLRTDLVEADREVVTKVGTYRCQVQSREGKDFVMSTTMYINKKLGVIKTEAISTHRPVKFYSELISFNTR
jgi:hypothetical protein